MLRRFDSWFFSLKWPRPLLLIMILVFVLAYFAYKKKSLSKNGAFATFVTGVCVFWGAHIQGFILLCFFFFSSVYIGKYCRQKQVSDSSSSIEKKGHTRDWLQVLANGLMAVIAALQYSNTNYVGALVMFGAALAESTSDTWAGEVGRLSKTEPVSLRTFKKVKKGISGGVTPLGFAAGFAGSLITALLWLALFRVKYGFFSLTVITLCGFSGCIVDSFLGATFQAMYLNEETDSLTEVDTDKDGNPRKLVRGLPWLDNDMVNLSSNLFSSFFALLLCKVM